MQKFISILIIAIIFGACSNSNKNSDKKNISDTVARNTPDTTQQINGDLVNFYSNFEKKELPFEFDTKDNKETKNQKNIFKKYFDISFPSPNDYIVLNYLIQTKKIFDIIIISAGNGENYTNYFLLTICKNKAEIIDTILVGEKGYIEMGADWNSKINIDKNLIVKSDRNTNSFDNITDLIVANAGYPGDILHKEYKINDDGTIKIISNKNKKSYLFKIKLYGKDSVFIANTARDYKNIKSACDIAHFCSNAYKINNIFNSEAKKLDESSEVNPDSLYKYYPYITLAWQFDKYEYSTQFNYYPLYQKALQTPEKDDNVFFDVYKKIYDADDNKKCFDLSKKLYTQNKIQLGNNRFFEAFSDIAKQSSKNNCFKQLFENLETCLVNMIDTCRYYGYSKDKVIEELNKITQEIEFKNKNKAELTDKISTITTLPSSNFNLK